jgi:hypothetical protein
MDTAIFSDSELGSGNRAHGHGGGGMSVHLDRFGKLFLAGLATHIENVPSSRLAFEVDEVDNASGVHSGLGLNAAAGCAEQLYFGGLGAKQVEGDEGRR